MIIYGLLGISCTVYCLDEQLYVGDRGGVTGRIFSLEFPVLPWILNPSTATTFTHLVTRHLHCGAFGCVGLSCAGCTASLFLAHLHIGVGKNKEKDDV